MQGPSAVTLETLTLAHFLDRATQLAASAQEIKALDAQVSNHTTELISSGLTFSEVQSVCIAAPATLPGVD